MQAAALPWLESIREKGRGSFAKTGYPSTALEAWKYTDTRAIAAAKFANAKGAAAVRPEAVEAQAFGKGERFVFVDGHFAANLSSPGASSLSQAIAKDPKAVEQHLAHAVPADENPFAALNAQHFADGAYVNVPPGAIVAEPIEIIHLSSGSRVASHPRHLVVLGENAQATVIETYAGPVEAIYFVNAVTEIVLEANAVLEHVKVQRESENAYHISTTEIVQARSSTADTHNVTFGASLSRNDLNVRLAGEGANANLWGLFVERGAQHVDHHTRIDHASPHCGSREVYKGVLDGSSRGVFLGRIIVHPGAQKTDAKQTNKNIILSKNALMDSTPQLEIYADDVKCTHGSTVGQLDPEQTFYLQSRGISAQTARSILTYAFARDVLSQIRAPGVAAALEKELLARLPGGREIAGVSA